MIREELEVGVKESFNKKLVRSGLTWAGHGEEWEMKTGKGCRCPEGEGGRR